MGDSYLGVIMALGFQFVPMFFGSCSGAQLPIAQNAALYSLLGTQFGGDGRIDFALPDLRGRSPVAFGTGPGLYTHQWGQKYGQEVHTLSLQELPTHTHAHSYATGGGGTISTPGSPAQVRVFPGAGDKDIPDDGDFLAAPGNSVGSVTSNAFIESPSQTIQLGGVTGGGGSGGFDTNRLQIGMTGASQAFFISGPRLAINFSICTQGTYPSRN